MSSEFEMNPVNVIMETLWIPLAATKSQKGKKLSKSPTPASEDTVAERQETPTNPALSTTNLRLEARTLTPTPSNLSMLRTRRWDKMKEVRSAIDNRSS